MSGLVTYYVLFFMHLATRRVQPLDQQSVAGGPAYPACFLSRGRLGGFWNPEGLPSLPTVYRLVVSSAFKRPHYQFVTNLERHVPAMLRR